MNKIREGRQDIMLGWQACLRCGKRTEGDSLLWKGGVSRVLCPDCAQKEQQEEQERAQKEK